MKNLSHLLKELVEKKTRTLTGVENIHGTLADIPVTSTITKVSDWQLYELGGSDMLSPDEIINQLSAVSFVTAPVTRAENGVLTVTTTIPGVHLFSTILIAPSAFSLAVQVEASGNQIALYSDETLIRRASGRLNSSMSIQEGLTPLNIVVFGPPTGVTITLPKDITTTILPYIPSAPTWRTPFAIETNYIDPKSGNTGNALFWENQEKAGGWGIYQLDSGTYGMVTRAVFDDGFYTIETNFSGEPTTPVLIRVNEIMVGTAVQARYDGTMPEVGPRLIFKVAPLSVQVDPLDIVSGTLYTISFVHLHDYVKTGGEATLTYVDTNVAAGDFYSYTLDAYSAFDKSIRSDKAEIQVVQAGDVIPPGDITLLSVDVTNNTMFIRYHTPTDADYLGTHAYYDNLDSGTMDSIILDIGQPDQNDTIVFQPIDSGTYRFPTFDKVGNEQHVYSGVSFEWEGDPGFIFANQPPAISVRQLTAADTVTDGFDPALFARYELDASDPDTAKVDLTLSYMREEDSDVWQDIGGGSLPSKVNVGKSNKDNWLRVRAYDGDLYSSELVFVSDFDVDPEISSFHGEILIDSGTVYIVGAVDDDAKSLKWYIDTDYTGPTGSDPTISSQQLIDNLDSTKTFNFTFGLTDGQRKTVKAVPYGDLAGAGSVGLAHREAFVRPPRTHVFTQDRTSTGGIQRTAVLVHLRPSPETATVFYKMQPLDYGEVTSATSSTLSDSGQNWVTDRWNDDYEVRITKGLGEGQTRTITDTTTTQLTISPNWTTTPNTTSEFYIGNRYQECWFAGTVFSATVNTLTQNVTQWIPDAFKGRIVEILTGTGVGETGTVTTNNATTLTVSANWGTTPVNGDTFRVSGPINVTKSASLDTVLYFYSIVPGIVQEEERSLTIDVDTLPEITSVTLSEPIANILRATISDPDDDVKSWALYVAKSVWPTLDTADSDSEVDPDFLRFHGGPNVTSRDFNAEDGTWYAVVIPYDSYTTPGPRVTDSHTVVGSPSTDPELSAISVVRQTSGGNLYNRISYNHNSICEKPGSPPGDYNIRVYGRRSDWPAETEETIIGDWSRYIWQDSEDGDNWLNEVHTTESANSDIGAGSTIHLANNWTKYTDVYTWYYRLVIYDTQVLVSEYNTQITNYYGKDIGPPP